MSGHPLVLAASMNGKSKEFNPLHKNSRVHDRISNNMRLKSRNKTVFVRKFSSNEEEVMKIKM